MRKIRYFVIRDQEPRFYAGADFWFFTARNAMAFRFKWMAMITMWLHRAAVVVTMVEKDGLWAER